MPKRYTIEDVRKIFKDEGCELLEETYVNSKTKMRYRCNCGILPGRYGEIPVQS